MIERRLSLTWTFSKPHHDADAVARAAAAHRDAVASLLDACARTPPGFAAARLDPRGLDRILARIRA